MNKTVRIVLYVLSLLTVAGLLTVFVLAAKQQGKPAGQDAAAGSEADETPGAQNGGSEIADGAENDGPDAEDAGRREDTAEPGADTAQKEPEPES